MAKTDVFILGYNIEHGIFKLRRAKIPLYSIRKESKNLTVVRINRKDVSKVFAILSDSWYNNVDGVQNPSENETAQRANYSVQKVVPTGVYALLLKGKRNIGLFVGACLFFALVIFSQPLILRTEVTGGGSYYTAEIKAILSEYGVKEWSFFHEEGIPVLSSRILSLKDVSFVTIKKDGYILKIQVEISPSQPKAESGNLVCDCSGRVWDITLINGTATVKPGDEVNEGEVLIYARNESGAKCLAVGTVRLVVTVSATALDEVQAEEKAKFLAKGNITDIKTVKGNELFTCTVTYLKIFTINTR